MNETYEVPLLEQAWNTRNEIEKCEEQIEHNRRTFNDTEEILTLRNTLKEKEEMFEKSMEGYRDDIKYGEEKYAHLMLSIKSQNIREQGRFRVFQKVRTETTIIPEKFYKKFKKEYLMLVKIPITKARALVGNKAISDCVEITETPQGAPTIELVIE